MYITVDCLTLTPVTSVLSEQLIADVLLPGLHCLHRDLQEVAPDHVTVLESMIREFQEKTPQDR